MDSREKVLNLRRRLLELEPPDEETAQALQTMASLSPLFLRMLPPDPEEIDRYLQLIAYGCISCRSDEAPELGLFELEGGETPAWRKVEL